LFSSEFLAATGEAAVGLLLSSPDYARFGPGYEEFLQQYQDRYGEPPVAPFHAHAYDAAMMILDAIKGAAVEGPNGTLLIGRQALHDALHTTQGLEGMTGILTCDEHGDCAEPRIAVYEIVNADAGSWNPGEGPDHNPVRIWP
jgi:branched-chain amino acid transport system substrate-binding protein